MQMACRPASASYDQLPKLMPESLGAGRGHHYFSRENVNPFSLISICNTVHLMIILDSTLMYKWLLQMASDLLLIGDQSP